MYLGVNHHLLNSGFRSHLYICPFPNIILILWGIPAQTRCVVLIGLDHVIHCFQLRSVNDQFKRVQQLELTVPHFNCT